MIKAIFMDYTGTMVQEDEPYTRELVRYFASHSNLKDPGEILRVVWAQIKEIEAGSSGDSFLRNDEKVDRILAYCAEKHGLEGDFSYIHEVWHKVWVHAPLFDDVKPFFERSKLPIYVLSNDDLCYLEESMRIKDLHPIGDSITSDIEPAIRLGITPIYISRKEPVSIDGVRVIRSLDEL